MERPHNYDWSIGACLVDQWEESKQTNLLADDNLYFIDKWSANLFVYMFSSLLPNGHLNKPN